MTGIMLLALLVLVALNAMFVAAEFALVKTSRAQLDDACQAGRRGARRALAQIDDLGAYLSACQLGITMASLAIGMVGEPAIEHVLEAITGGVLPHGVQVAAAFAVSYLLVTALHITLGEQVPKLYAIARPVRVACWCSGPLLVFRMVGRPFIWALERVSEVLLRPLGVHAGDAHGSASAQELRQLITDSATGGQLDSGEAGMLHGVFHLHEQEARQVMTPFPDLATIDQDATVAEAIEACQQAGHTRLVVLGEAQSAVGVVHAADLAGLALERGPGAKAREVLREAPIVPESRPLDDLLSDMQREHWSLVLACDEYGRLVGVVRFESVVEEIVGELADETDTDAPLVRRDGADLLVAGHLALGDLADHGVQLEAGEEDVTSVGGLLFSLLGRLPQVGDYAMAGPVRLQAAEMAGARVALVRVTPAD